MTNTYPKAEDKYVGIYCQLTTDLIELTRAQILFPRPMQIRDTEPNSKYYLEEYLNIAYSKNPHFI